MFCSRLAITLCAVASLARCVDHDLPPTCQQQVNFFDQQSAFLDKANVRCTDQADLLKRLEEFLRSQDAVAANATSPLVRLYHRQKLMYHQTKVHHYVNQIRVHDRHWEFLNQTPAMNRNQTPLVDQLQRFHRDRIAFNNGQVDFHQSQLPIHEHVVTIHQDRMEENPKKDSTLDRLQAAYHKRQKQFHVEQARESENLLVGHNDQLAKLNETVKQGNISELYKKQFALSDRYKAYHKDQIAYFENKNLFHGNRADVHRKLTGLNFTEEGQ